jgi:hypothetical protein
MTVLTMMYVYFDDKGNIKAISPDSNTVSDSLYKIAMFPLAEVEPFLTAKKNTFDFYVKVIEKFSSIEYKITKKQVLEVSHLRTLETSLTEITTHAVSKNTIILIENFIIPKQIKITITPEMKYLQSEGSEEDQVNVTNFINTPTTPLFFTRKHDPYFLIHTVFFNPKELFDKSELVIPYEMDLSNLSIFTRKIVNKYAYIERYKV